MGTYRVSAWLMVAGSARCLGGPAGMPVHSADAVDSRAQARLSGELSSEDYFETRLDWFTRSSEPAAILTCTSTVQGAAPSAQESVQSRSRTVHGSSAGT